MVKTNSHSSTKDVPALQSYTIAKGINGILWIWEKQGENLWKVYAYEAPHKFHFEDDKGNQVSK